MRPYTGVTSRAAEQVCLEPVKRATCIDFVAKSRTSLYFLQQIFRNLQQPDLLQDRFEYG